jgi:hypothetical protein
VGDLAKDLKVEGAASLNDIAAAKGVNLDVPAGLFVDVTRSVDSAIAAAEKVKAAQTPPPAEAAKPAEGEKKAEAKGAEGEKKEEPKAAEGEKKEDPKPAAAPAVKAPQIKMEELELPSWVVAVGVSDAAKAEATLQEIVAKQKGLREHAGQPITVGGITISVYGNYGYFFSGKHVFVGALEMLKATAERIAAPAVLRYGSADCPATAPDEAAMLVYGERFLPLIKKVLPYVEISTDIKPMVDAQVATFEAMMSAQGGEDPIVSTFAWTKDMIELQTRMDSGTHPDMLKMSGQPKPLRIAQLLPDSTQVLFDVRLTPEFKKQITDNYLKGLPKDLTQSPMAAQNVTIATQVMTLLGEEIGIGIASGKDNIPTFFVMLDLSKADATRALIEMLVPMEVSETYKELPIKNIMLRFSGVRRLLLAMPGNFVLVSNNPDAIKRIIDLNADMQTSNLMATIQPPLDPATPRYTMFMLNTRVFDEVILPLVMLAPKAPPEVKAIADQVTAVLREVRFVSELNGSWQSSRMTFYLKEPPAKPAEDPAKPAEAPAKPAEAPAPAPQK